MGIASILGPLLGVAQASAAGFLVPGEAACADRSSLSTIALVEHNATRRTVGLPPLQWSARLADEARAHAARLARSESLYHDPSLHDDVGENLWMGTRCAYAARRMIDAWAREASLYRHGRFPDISRTGDWADTGHYSQMVWRDTREVGCALAGNGADEYLVCRYAPAGNIEGEFAY